MHTISAWKARKLRKALELRKVIKSELQRGQRNILLGEETTFQQNTQSSFHLSTTQHEHIVCPTRHGAFSSQLKPIMRLKTAAPRLACGGTTRLPQALILRFASSSMEFTNHFSKGGALPSFQGLCNHELKAGGSCKKD